MSKFASLVNSALAPLNIALTRRTTLETTRSQLASVHVELVALRSEIARAHEEAAKLRGQASEARHSAADLSGIEAKFPALQSSIEGLRRELLRHQIAVRWSVVDAMERTQKNSPEYRTCPLCKIAAKSETFKSYLSNCIFGGGVLKRHQCPACDAIFGSDKMFNLSSGELGLDYEWHYKVYEEGDSTEAELRAFHSLNPRRDGVYVNYGAGSWSRTVPLLREQGWNVFAYEPHGAASAGGDWLISSEKQMWGKEFDGIFSNNVLEHLREPADDLRRMKAWMKPGATMAHATPCFEYLYEFTRFHLFFFPGRSREILAERAGLSIQKFEVDGEFMNCVFAPISN